MECEPCLPFSLCIYSTIGEINIALYSVPDYTLFVHNAPTLPVSLFLLSRSGPNQGSLHLGLFQRA